MARLTVKRRFPLRATSERLVLLMQMKRRQCDLMLTRMTNRRSSLFASIQRTLLMVPLALMRLAVQAAMLQTQPMQLLVLNAATAGFVAPILLNVSISSRV